MKTKRHRIMAWCVLPFIASVLSLPWGISLGLPISRAGGVKFAYIGTRTQVGTGLNSDTFATALTVAW